MAKVDWEEHRKTFELLREERGITYKEYAEHQGLNPNTVRRQFSQKAGENQGKKASQKSDHSDELIISRKGRKAPHSKAMAEVTEPRDGTADKKPESTKAKDKHAKKIILPAVVHTPKPRGKGKQFEEDNEAKLVPNRRGRPRQVDYSSADNLAAEGLEISTARTLYDTLAHMELLKRTTARAVGVFEEEIAELERPKSRNRDEDDEGPGGPHPVLKLTKLLIEVGYLMNDHVSRVEAITTSRDKNRRENEKHQMKVSEGEVIAQAFVLREENDWDIFETAEYIEKHGVKLPASIALRLEKEIRDAEPEVEKGGEVDDDQLEEEARRYRAQQARREVIIQDKRDAVARIVDERGYGDTTQDGSRREGEFEDDTEGLDIDYEATADIYDEHAEVAIEPPEDEE